MQISKIQLGNLKWERKDILDWDFISLTIEEGRDSDARTTTCELIIYKQCNKATYWAFSIETF